MSKPHTYARPWLLVDHKFTVVSRYASRNAAYDAWAMYGKAYRAIHVDELDEAQRIAARISKGKWT